MTIFFRPTDGGYFTGSCGCRKPDRVSRGALVLMDQSTEKFTPLHSCRRTIDMGRRRGVLAAPCRALDVVGGRCSARYRQKHRFEVTTAGDEKSVQALAPQRADKAFRDGVGERSLDRCADDLDALGPKDLIESPRVPRVTVADQEPERKG